MEKTKIVYNDTITRQFIAASVVFAIVGMLVGVVVALQLAFWPANVHEWLTFGRLRPLHTNAVIFAFVGNMLFAGVYYSTQRLLKTRIASDTLSSVHFWGWQLIIVAAAVSLPLGITSGKEYAELEWPIDIAIAVVWVVFAINFFWTIAIRREKHLYVALWFYIATIVTVAMLHIVNSLAIPVGPLDSYSIFSGVQDALVQWWYGHNAVAFFLTTPILGIMYYFLPKAAERPVFSYRLSIIHFWGLVFIYIWAGPHHLLYTALPEWAQTLGMVFSVMLIAPSWGGMINGLLTLRGAWEKLRDDPVLKFFAAGVTFYGMSTFEGPLLSIKSVNGLAHYTDWIIGHVHAGALGWNGFMAAGLFYYLVPKLYGTKLYSKAAANYHFWIGTLGILLYVVSMWVAGVTQGLMWRAENEAGGLLYPNFVETLLALSPMYWTRLVGGTLYLVGFFMLAWNLWMTAKSGAAVDGEAEVAELDRKGDEPGWASIVFGKPVLLMTAATALLIAIGFLDSTVSTVLAIGAVAILAFSAWVYWKKDRAGKAAWHSLLEGRGLLFTVLTVVAVLVGGAFEIVPTILIAPQQGMAEDQQPYSALELQGRDIYLQEGCYVCHSQMIRPFTWETARYGEVSELADSAWDHPFQWGSRRIGPDLARVGGKYSDTWHLRHLIDPREISPGSNMPSYAHLARTSVDDCLDGCGDDGCRAACREAPASEIRAASPLDFGEAESRVRAMRSVGVPYTAEQVASAEQDARRLATDITARLRRERELVSPDTPVVALIAYLQRLGLRQSRTVPPAGEGDVQVADRGGR